MHIESSTHVKKRKKTNNRCKNLCKTHHLIKIKQNTGKSVTSKFVELFSGYHECRQVGSVNGKEHDGKHGPYICHESGSKATWRVYVYGCLEQYSPNEPVRPE